MSDSGYSDCSDIEGSLYREKYNIRKRKKRKPFPREQDFPEEEVTGNTSFDNTVVENNPSEKFFLYSIRRGRRRRWYT